MAIWIRVADIGAELATVITQSVTPANGRCFGLEELQRMVGGSLEALHLHDGTIMWLNEDGKRENLPYNPVAHLIATHQAALAWRDYVVGDVVIATRAESGEGEEN